MVVAYCFVFLLVLEAVSIGQLNRVPELLASLNVMYVTKRTTVNVTEVYPLVLPLLLPAKKIERALTFQ
jgi:hypothetical protein